MSNTKINLNQLDGEVYTEDNLVGGTNITLEDKVIESGGIDEHTLALWNFDNTLTDVISNNVFPADAGGAPVSYENSEGFFKFSYSVALYLSSSANLIGEFTNSIQLGKTFTIDFWYRHPQYAKIGFLYWPSGSVSPQTLIEINDNNLNIIINNNSQTICDSILKSQLYHIAIVCNNGVFKVYINGIDSTISGTGDLSSSWNGFELNRFSFGTVTGWGGTKACIDELRISDTARWTADFTPPTEPYNDSPAKVVKSINSNNSIQSTNISNIVTLTQAEYDALVQAGTASPTTFYAIVPEDSD